jgi:uncharacterized protein
VSTDPTVSTDADPRRGSDLGPGSVPRGAHGSDREPPTVRRPRWVFPDDLDDIFAGPDLDEDCFRVAFSLTLPHLEPYLIRTCRRLLPRVADAALVADIEAFCGQEAQHHRSHATVNRIIHRQVGPVTAARLRHIEEDLAADYRRFTAQRSDRFNAAYAEGFEAMTCSMGLTTLAHARPSDRWGPWQQLWAWHLAEEIEHRTVAFDLYHQVGGTYRYRVAMGIFAQGHFLRALDRLHRVLVDHLGRPPRRLPYLPRPLRLGWRRLLGTYLPGYDPVALEVPPQVGALLAIVDVSPSAQRPAAHDERAISSMRATSSAGTAPTSPTSHGS